MHSLIRAEDVKPKPEYVGHSRGFSRASVACREMGSVHTAMGLCCLEAGGRIDMHVQSFEEVFYVTQGNPVLVMDGRGWVLAPGACGVVPVGVPHGWIGGDSEARWIDNLSPHPRGPDAEQPDVFFVDESLDVTIRPLDIRDPRSRNFFLMRDDDIDVAKLQRGASVNAPTVSASMATAVMAYSGIAVKMLVDKRLDAELSNMFMVEYMPDAVAHPHDHPLEEAYFIFDGEVDAVADGIRYTLKPGDVLWTGVGSIHAFYNTSGKKVRWLETQSPQPPAQHSYRFSRDWEYFAGQSAVKNRQAASD